MVPLDRSGVRAPPDWEERVARSLADAGAFRRKARAFDRLALHGKKRRAGFKAYAAHVFKDGEFPALWQCQELKILLEAMTAGHCAYCQASVEDSSYSPVEHFRPKSRFPLLAYEIDNYFYSCQRCNLAKLDRWPASGAYVRPDHGDPSARFRFKASGVVKVARGDADALATLRDFGLNRKGLKKQRRNAILAWLRALAAVLTMPGLTDEQRARAAKPYLQERLSRFSEAINQNVKRAWRRSIAGAPPG